MIVAGPFVRFQRKGYSMRKSGILLHPTSLPGEYGIGDLGNCAYRFADFLAESGQSLWQILPLGPPGYGNSPYQCYSSMAGNPLLVSLEALCQEGLLTESHLHQKPGFPQSSVDFGSVIPFRWKLLKRAARTFFKSGSAKMHHEFEQFCAQNAYWLDRFAEFAALKEANGWVSWTSWNRRSDPAPIEQRVQKFIQFQFFRQWSALRRYCRERGIRIIGDLPIFVAHDSADVWGNPGLFDLNEDGSPNHVAGVPPDYFSATGQLWGNPLYRWEVMEQDGYQWWVDRIRCMLELVDLIRIDHFRGFEKYYQIPGDATTAVEGEWMDGPGDSLFATLEDQFGKLPFIAEDLGFITPEVHALRDRWGFPGMRFLQFAFGTKSASDPFKPYNFIRNCIVYTGTHDNDTTVGWFAGADPGDSTRTVEQVHAEREFALCYLDSDGKEIHWDFIRAALASVADTAIFPMQDLLGLGSEARMNRPSKAEKNWEWRLNEDQLKTAPTSQLRLLTQTYGRLP